ncbi:unnamed protein product, partial [marine sediment metagenome]
MSGDAKDEDKGASGFNPLTGQITLQGTGFSTQVKAGTIFRVLNISSVEIDVEAIKVQTDKISGKMLFCMDFWSEPVEEVALTTTAGDKTLPKVTVADLPTGATIVRAIAMVKLRMADNTNADNVNGLDGATVAGTSQVIQVADDTPGTY